MTENDWSRVFKDIFKPTFELLDFKCMRSDVKTGSILQNIVTNIHQASVVFADLTDSKPNVLYELGIAHAITPRVIMASQKVDECPSDLKPYGIIGYNAEPKHEEIVEFQYNVREALLKLSNPSVEAGPVSQYLRKTMHSLEELANNPIAIMQCTNCGLLYETRLGETTQSDSLTYATDEKGNRTHPIALEHQNRHLCGHWECARFLGLKGIHFSKINEIDRPGRK